ncbi:MULTISPECIES: response regulator transcription factor [unclassified Oceanispirochaeta]|uniref:response regulator n=1 Tax=unclassified Oceanispirochaeta TaxID=2635722 RepID=UPI000E09418C|nr:MULTISPECIES: response regulator transcription factor [unclassified Oceanispirochaeta]MBF9014004.1 response regulator transcription factor [Oceanispirochaeta sp. M2]NPD70495.1 response regulator transcription factor [Oceanispirochaeta sp. M1]RDG34264.1 DNA-binding response regulator [Oceanispirochaeta sp. M1]
MNKIKILLVDDQILFINSLKTVLETKGKEIDVIGVCYNGEEAIDFCRHHSPDMILMDVKMPVIDGVKAAKSITESQPLIKIVMLTTFDEDEYVKEALNVGAKGYLLKDMLPEDLIYAVKTVMNGMMPISPSIIKQSMTKGVSRDVMGWFKELNSKELEILKLITHGYDNQEIAEEVNLAGQTVKNYVSNIYEKMDVRDRMQAMRLCIDLKLFEE